MDGFGKLQKIRSGESAEDKNPVESVRALAFLPHTAEKTFDNLPLHIQAWAKAGMKPRCNGGK